MIKLIKLCIAILLLQLVGTYALRLPEDTPTVHAFQPPSLPNTWQIAQEPNFIMKYTHRRIFHRTRWCSTSSWTNGGSTPTGGNRDTPNSRDSFRILLLQWSVPHFSGIFQLRCEISVICLPKLWQCPCPALVQETAQVKAKACRVASEWSCQWRYWGSNYHYIIQKKHMSNQTLARYRGNQFTSWNFIYGMGPAPSWRW